MNDIQKRAVEQTVQELYPEHPELFRDKAKARLHASVSDRNNGFTITTDKMGYAHRMAWERYNQLLMELRP